MIIRHGAGLSGLALLAACGGGGGTPITSTPPPAPAPAPAPSPTPAPTPAPAPAPSSSQYDTAEYRRSDGPAQHNAITAWDAGYTGKGSTIAIIDTGIDTTSPEFAGRILADSQDVAGTRSIQATDDHGTNVALVAAAARNNSGVMGIAFDASLLVLRTDTPGSCTATTPGDTSAKDTCTFSDTNIAKGIDKAVAAGAKVINLSLGGNGAGSVVTDAVARASAAGVVVIVAAGNGGDGSDTTTDPNQPDAFASAVRQAGGNNVIIVGSVDANNVMSTFSQRAGSQADWYLDARGEDVCCVYDNGQIYVGHDASGSFNLVFSGTSFAAPQVAGAVALLAQAFPNLTGQQIVDILLKSAKDLGTTGTDSTYGRGLLDIAAAMQPMGVSTLAGSTSAVRIGSTSVVGSPAMGDALAGYQSVPAIVLDGYKRAYQVDFGAGTRSAALQPRLTSSLMQGGRAMSAGTANLTLAFTVSDTDTLNDGQWTGQLRLSGEDASRARVLAAYVAARISPRTQLAFATRQGASGLVEQLQGAQRPAFMIASAADQNSGFAQTVDSSLAIRRMVGSTGITVSAETGDAWLDHTFDPTELVLGRNRTLATRRVGLSADRQLGPIATTLGMNWLQEDSTVLGAYLAPQFGGSGADTVFLDGSAALPIVRGWTLTGAVRQGFTRVRAGGALSSGSSLRTSAWSMDFSNSSVFTPGDSFGFRISQPLRVDSGGLNLWLPISYSYATEAAQYGFETLSLAPSGREIDGELAWRGPLWGGFGSASLFVRHNPGNYATLPTDKGVAFRWSANF
ncbi:MAG: S8 family peptidase [Sphingomonadaceae bacterium]